MTFAGLGALLSHCWGYRFISGFECNNVCVVVHRAAGAAAAAAPDRKTHIPHGAAETGRDEGPPAKGAAGPAGVHTPTLRSDGTHTHQEYTSDLCRGGGVG